MDDARCGDVLSDPLGAAVVAISETKGINVEIENK
jgi:hypothetical protein